MTRPKAEWERARPTSRPCGCDKCGKIIDMSLGLRARSLKYHPECDGQHQRKLELDRSRERKRSYARKQASVDARARAAARANMGNAPGRCGSCSGLAHRAAHPWCRECGLAHGVHPGDTQEFIRNQAMMKQEQR